jgi:hypothetical protein
MATVATDRPACQHLDKQPPKECPAMVGFLWSRAITWA